MDYKYFHYINKKNRKFHNLNKTSNPNESDIFNNLINEFKEIKKNKKKRFHRNRIPKEELI